jgi:glycosyltransferase involved in cell wall biosynthesis
MRRILVLTPELPYPPHQGASLRNFFILKGLAQNHAVTLLSFSDRVASQEPVDTGPLPGLLESISIEATPRRSRRDRLLRLLTSREPDMAYRLASNPFTVRLRSLLQEQAFDIVQIEGLELAYTLPVIRSLGPRSSVLFDNHNAETALQWRAFLTDLQSPSRWPLALYSWAQVGRLERFERWICAQADAVTAVSEADRRALAGLVPAQSITVIPNCIDVSTYVDVTSHEVPAFDLVFSGKMDYRPNVDAVLWFAHAVWPRIREARPGTTLAIVGQKPHPRLDALRDAPGITVTGWVEQVQPYLAGATVFVMPFRMGSGTRLKLIEALAAGKPVVSTTLGAEGFGLRSGQGLLLADTPNEFATAVLTLLTQPDQRARLVAAGRQIAERYDWRQVVPRFEIVHEEMLRKAS